MLRSIVRTATSSVVASRLPMPIIRSSIRLLPVAAAPTSSNVPSARSLASDASATLFNPSAILPDPSSSISGPLSSLPEPTKVSSANLKWSELGFSFVPTDCYVKYTWRDGVWSTVATISKDANINIHVLSNALHYGQSLFEGEASYTTDHGRHTHTVMVTILGDSVNRFESSRM
jgi:hypothetical protein